MYLIHWEETTLQISTQAEEERLGINFANVYEQELLPESKALVQGYLVPAAGAAPMKKQDNFATGCERHAASFFTRQ